MTNSETTVTASDISIIIPAKNEAAGLQKILPALHDAYPAAEIIVVDDGSTDNTAQVVSDHRARLIQHPYSIGNGGAVKSGARSATRPVLVFMDADGQHDPADILELLQKLSQGYDMVVGARDTHSQAGLHRAFANLIYNRLSSWIVGHRINDLTSGLRAARTDKFREFLHLLPNGFSYPTTSTMAFFRSGYSVAYEPIHTKQRQGKSHIRLFHDGFRFLIIIFRIGTLYSPLKVFIPISFAFFALGLTHYAYTFLTSGRLTNMSALLLSVSVIVFLIGLVSEQITQLMFHNDGDNGSKQP